MTLVKGKLSRVMTAHPDHHTSTSALGNICAQAIADIKKCLVGQREADTAAAKKREEEEKSQVEQERLAAEQAEREKLEREKKLAE